MRFAELALDPTTHQAFFGADEISLSAKEFALLEALIDRAGAVLSRAQLEQRLYGWDEEVESNAVEVHIHNLRKKLGGDWIRNVRGIGYTLAKS
jgi:two-component system, OmpR family, response regulator QseB